MNNNLTKLCQDARRAIEARRFIGWQGLPRCTPEMLFGIPLDEQWGELPLGDSFEPARSRLLDIDGYYRPLTYARNGQVILFDGTNPALAEGGWSELADDLGRPEAQLDWIHGALEMPGGERVYANKGITVFLNPENDFVIHVSLYLPTTVEEYVQRIRLNREKSLGLRPSISHDAEAT